MARVQLFPFLCIPLHSNWLFKRVRWLCSVHKHTHKPRLWSYSSATPPIQFSSTTRSLLPFLALSVARSPLIMERKSGCWNLSQASIAFGQTLWIQTIPFTMTLFFLFFIFFSPGVRSRVAHQIKLQVHCRRKSLSSLGIAPGFPHTPTRPPLLHRIWL